MRCVALRFVRLVHSFEESLICTAHIHTLTHSQTHIEAIAPIARAYDRRFCNWWYHRYVCTTAYENARAVCAAGGSEQCNHVLPPCNYYVPCMHPTEVWLLVLLVLSIAWWCTWRYVPVPFCIRYLSLPLQAPSVIIHKVQGLKLYYPMSSVIRFPFFILFSRSMYNPRYIHFLEASIFHFESYCGFWYTERRRADANLRTVSIRLPTAASPPPGREISREKSNKIKK